MASLRMAGLVFNLTRSRCKNLHFLKLKSLYF
jgi:hypothetical protein